MKILWKGQKDISLEFCRIEQTDAKIIIHSTIIGCADKQPYEVRYMIDLDKRWNIQNFVVDADVNGIKWKIIGSNHDNKWQINSGLKADFASFKFIDISLTPLTNTLPINSLVFKISEPQEIEVLYIDILKNEFKVVHQRYTKVYDNRYLYENTDTDFKAILPVDKDGFVENYPGLFERIV